MEQTPDYTYHHPVMLKECLDGLMINPEGIYVDVTFGGGGHSKAILSHLTTGRLFSFDQDEDAYQEAQKIDNPQFTFVQANFRFISRYLRVYGIKQVDGILADLGISSHQIDTPERGFSTRFNAELDMRMGTNIELTAKDIVNKYTTDELHKLLGMYGEIKNARTAAQTIVAARSTKPIETVEDIKTILKKLAPKGKEHKYFAQVFQALRIVVNDEMGALEDFLTSLPDVLKPSGRVVIMSYHSLEDRLVKNYFRSGKFSGEVEKDLFGNDLKPLDVITRKSIEATAEEIALNPRARSAKLRIAQKPSK